MPQTPIYFDNHSTTPVDPRVFAAMQPYFMAEFGNASSQSHSFGWKAKEAVDRAREQVAVAVNAKPREIVFTSGATESNNLAIRGVCEHPRNQRRRVVSVLTEHKAVLDPLKQLEKKGFEITLLPVDGAGLLDLNQIADTITDEVALVSVMFANNEIGVIHSIGEIGALCKERGVALHCDATQAVGKVEINVRDLGVDLLSFSAHKIYGPKGVGGLVIRRGAPRLRIETQVEGGGQENGFRAGTLNTPGIIGLGEAITLANAERDAENDRLYELRRRLITGLQNSIEQVAVNGPLLNDRSLRLTNNLNCSFAGVDGESLMMSMGLLAVSSGSACTSNNPEPSHVLRALGIEDDLIRASLRFGLGRFNTDEEVDRAIEMISDAVRRLRSMS